jgi:hypothetical protein
MAKPLTVAEIDTFSEEDESQDGGNDDGSVRSTCCARCG